MEQFTRNNPVPESQSSRSSFYSTDSAGNRVSYMDENRTSSDTTRTTSSRPISVTPSYMSAAVPRRKPAPIMTQPLPASPMQQQQQQQPPASTTSEVAAASAGASAASAAATKPRPSPLGAPRASKGLLLLMLAGEPAPHTIQHIRVLFKRHAFSGITILGKIDHETKLKQLRIDIYSLIGKMQMELGVQTYLRESFSEEETRALLNDAVGKVDERIRAVLCVPHTEALVEAGDILMLDEGQIAETWRQSFGFIHTVARCAFPLFMLDGSAKRVAAGFFVTQTIDQGAATAVMRSACGLLLRQLAEGYRAKGLAVGYAEENLIPEPEPEPEPEPVVMELNNAHDTPRNSSFAENGGGAGELAVTPGESPTKLWGMWALQEQLGD